MGCGGDRLLYCSELRVCDSGFWLGCLLGFNLFFSVWGFGVCAVARILC